MAFAPTIDDLCTNAKQSFHSHASFYSSLPLSPSLLSPNLHPDDQLSTKGYITNLMTDSICESTIGRELSLMLSFVSFCLSSHLTFLLVVLFVFVLLFDEMRTIEEERFDQPIL